MSAPRELSTYHQEPRAVVEALSRSSLGLGDPDAKANALKRRFRSISRRYERSLASRRILRKTTQVAGGGLLLLALLSAPIAITAYLWDWPFMTTARHFMAWPNCGVAREAGLAPAFRGAPGYWLHHDVDRDGIACESWPRRR
jgi:hypothetical protein